MIEFDEDKYATVLAQYQPRPIHTEADNQRAIDMLEGLHTGGALTPEHEALAEILTILIETFEENHYAFEGEDVSDAQRTHRCRREHQLSPRDSEAFASAILDPPQISENVVSRLAAAQKRIQT